MKTKYITTKAVVVFLVSLVLVLISFNAGVGGLEPPGPPGSPESSMSSLDEIYAAASGTQPPQPAAYDMFLKIDSIPGECTDDKHKDWIKVLSYKHGVSHEVSDIGGGGVPVGRCDHQDFSVVKTLDKASPKLALFCSKGDLIDYITMELCRTSDDKPRFMRYHLEDVIITSVSPGGSAQGSDPLPMEEVSFNYKKIEWTYTDLDGKGNDVMTNWDLEANKGY